MMRRKFFIAGTDTDAGKTFVSCALLEKAKSLGLSCYGLKPVAAGCEDHGEGLRNDDALKLMESASIELSYTQVNPVALKPAIAPHVAAKQIGITLNASRIVGFCQGALTVKADIALIEGAGGWRVPLNARETLAEVPRQLNLPVILVVGVKLGCINHALLSVEAIARDGLTLAGWVANHIDPEMSCSSDSVETLQAAISAPLLGRIPYIEGAEATSAASYLQLEEIL
ncbi:MAG: dethiobiotin synthase [Pseudomonadales bacterium]